MKKLLCAMVLTSIVILQCCPLSRAASPATPTTEAQETPISMVVPSSMESKISLLVSAYKAKTGKSVDVDYIENPDDYITKMNSEILAGKGPDIFLAGSIPYWDYAKMGMLVDIGKLIEKDPDMDIHDYREIIFDPLRDANGKLYVMPCSYRFYIVFVNAPLLEKYGVSLPEKWSFESVYDTCVDFTDKTRDVLGVYAMNGGSVFWNEALLSEITYAIDYSKGESHVSELPDSLFGYINSTNEISSDGNFDPQKMPCVFTLSYSKQETKFQYGRNLRVWLFFEHNDFEFRTFPRAKDSDKAMYNLENAFCINKNGNVEEAWEFIKFVLSEEVQSGMPEVISEPVLKTAVDYRFQKVREYLAEVMDVVKKGEDYSLLVGETRHTPDEFEGAVESYILNYTKLLDNVGAPEIQDARLDKNISSALTPDQNGKIDPVEVKAEVARVVDVYLQEMGGDVQRGYTVLYIAVGAIVIIILSAMVTNCIRKKKKAH